MTEYKGTAASVVLRSDGIIEFIPNEEWDQPDTLELATEILDIAKKLTVDQPRGIIAVVPTRYLPKEILSYYQNTEVGDVARALVLDSFAAKVIGNLYFQLSKGKPNEAGRIIPTKLFTDKQIAIEWLLQQMAKYKV